MSRYTANIITKSPATPTGPTTTGRAPGIWRMDDVAYWTRQGLWPNPSIQAPDTYFPYVSLLLSTTSLGNANNNLFVDSSGAFNPVSRNGNATQGSFTPYSTNWSNYFAGAGSYLQTPANSATTIVGTLSSTANLTIECWIFPTAYNSSANFPGLIGDMVATAENNNWSWGITNTGTLMLYWNISGTQYRASTTSTVSLNTWTHIALNVAAGAITMYINGVSQTLTGTTTLGTPSGSNNYLVIGQWNNGSGGTGGTSHGLYTGYISNLRVVKASTYTSNFTVPTAPLSVITSTSLLTCQSNRFRDASTNNLTLTVAGSMAVTDFGPFSPAYPGASYNQSDITNWSGYFDGTGDYLSVPASSSLTLGTGDFTIEMWLYSGANSTSTRLAGNGAGAGWGANKWVMGTGYAGSANKFFMSVNNGGTLLTSTTTFNDSAWHHAAVTRSGNTWRLFVDGVQEATLTSSVSVDGGVAANISIGSGQISGDADWAGFISNFRIVKGTAVYTSNFTPSTTNLTAISGTSLLTLQNAAFTDNSTNNFIITPFGNTTVTGNSPFNTTGYWSNYFDGASNQYLSVSNNAALDLPSNTSFTIEGWVFPTRPNNGSQSGFRNVVSKRVANSLTSNYNIMLNYNSEKMIFYNGATISTSSANIPQNAWTHFAYVYNGATSLKLYINGTLDSTFSVAPGGTNSAPVTIGSLQDDTGTWDNFGGYISNIRIVKGSQVYTSNFTVPTTPLTAVSGTSLLTCQNGQFIDNSSNAFTVTPNNSPQVQSFDPFYTATIASNGGSMYFDGSGDYLRGANSPAFSFGTGNFTVEMWAYFMDPTATNRPLFDNGATSNTGRLLIRQGNDAGTANVVNAFVSGTTVSSPAIQFFAWNHVAVVRNSGTVTIYINGVGGTGVSATADLSQNACLLGAFYDQLAWNFTGYMSNVRVTKGTALYTANFTPPTAPVSPTPATTLLVNGMNAGAYDATTINNMETVGNTQVRYPWPFAPANYWAGWFDGNGDYLSYPEQVGDLGTADWTLECWAYPTATPPNYASLLNKNWTFSLQTGDFQWSIKHDDGFMSFAYVGSGGGITNITSTLAPALNTWTHYAVTRSGTTLRIYANGVLNTTATLPAGLSFGTASTIPVFTGYNSRDNCYYTGYISNLRVVAGTALYTGSTYTVPTTPLTAITNTSLLTCQNKTFIDNSSNAFTITSFGNAAAGAIGPFTATGGTSTYFDGSGDNLFMPSSPSMNCGTGNWTVEGWVCTLTRTTNYPLIFGNNRGGFTTDALAITASNSDSASFNDKFVVAWGSGGWSSPSAGNSALLVSNVTNSNGVWYHLAVVRNGTSVKMYRNGIEVASATVSSGATFNWGFNGSLAGGGNWDGAQGNWNGYLDDLRITNGVARYTSNFTPPTQAFPTY